MRYWNDIEEKMYILRGYETNIEGKLICVRFLDGGFNTIDCKNENMMMSTGMKDKNGKEIFEGDICKVRFSNGVIAIGVVELNDGCFDINFIESTHNNKFRDYLKCYTCHNAVKIIGNIHENPDKVPSYHCSRTGINNNQQR